MPQGQSTFTSRSKTQQLMPPSERQVPIVMGTVLDLPKVIPCFALQRQKRRISVDCVNSQTVIDKCKIKNWKLRSKTELNTLRGRRSALDCSAIQEEEEEGGGEGEEEEDEKEGGGEGEKEKGEEKEEEGRRGG